AAIWLSYKCAFSYTRRDTWRCEETGMGQKNTMERNLVSFKDVQIAYLMEGIGGVEKLMESGQVSKPTIRRALKKFHETGAVPAEFERWVAERVGPIGRGRSAPSI